MRVDVQLDQVRLLQSLSDLNKPRFYAASRVSLEAVFLYTILLKLVSGSNLALKIWINSESSESISKFICRARSNKWILEYFH